MKRAPLLLGLALLAAAWLIAGARLGMTGHMAAHMTSVAIAAPFVAYGIAATPADPALRWPRTVAPLPMSLVELVVVWGWHVPAAQAFARSGPVGLAIEQATFFAAGLLLWSACLGSGESASGARRAAGIGALLLTTMHMTLLGVLLALAPRPLFGPHGHTFGLDPIHDQQLAGVVMLVVGGGAYLLGGLALLARVLGAGPARAARS